MLPPPTFGRCVSDLDRTSLAKGGLQSAQQLPCKHAHVMPGHDSVDGSSAFLSAGVSSSLLCWLPV